MLLYISLGYLIYALVFGIVFRTIEQKTKQEVALEYVHPHLLTLGFLFHLILFVIIRNNTNEYLIPIIVFNLGLIVSSISWMINTLKQFALKINQKLPIIFSGIGHILMSIGLIWLMIELIKVFN